MHPDTKEIQIVETGLRQGAGQFAEDVLKGLSSKKKRLPSRYFYDEKGSRLFEEIMKLDEYYLTNCEWDIFRKHKQDFLDLLQGEAFHLVDLGAGDAQKTRVLLNHFSSQNAKYDYVPIDINRDILEELGQLLAEEIPGLNTIPILAEYFDALDWIGKNQSGRKLVLFMGSNIGNFSKAGAAVFLTRMCRVMNPGDLLLIGVDLKKDPRQILRAYDDSKGVTARFNLNLLERINRELGGDFEIDNWRHYANYNPINGAVKSYLISQIDQKVTINSLKKTFSFDAFEAIHTEYSYKYTLKEIELLADNCGFVRLENFVCQQAGFVDSVWRVRG